MTEKYSKSLARTIANNHEWGIIMITPMLTHYESTYEELLDEGYTSDEASTTALADTVASKPDHKYMSVILLQDSFETFSNYFSDDNIMDFWNNCYGRAYAEDGSYDNAVEAYEAACEAGDLVIDAAGSNVAANVTYTNRFAKSPLLTTPLLSCYNNAEIFHERGIS